MIASPPNDPGLSGKPPFPWSELGAVAMCMHVRLETRSTHIGIVMMWRCRHHHVGRKWREHRGALLFLFSTMLRRSPRIGLGSAVSASKTAVELLLPPLLSSFTNLAGPSRRTSPLSLFAITRRKLAQAFCLSSILLDVLDRYFASGESVYHGKSS